MKIFCCMQPILKIIKSASTLTLSCKHHNAESYLNSSFVFLIILSFTISLHLYFVEVTGLPAKVWNFWYYYSSLHFLPICVGWTLLPTSPDNRGMLSSLSLSLLIILKLMDNIKIVSNKCLFEICKVPGERVVGSYVLDDLKEYVPVHLQSTAEVHLCTFIFMF